MEPNKKFVEAFDNFCSFSKAAGFIEDWIRTKKNNATDFTTDFPAVLERGKLVRAILLHLRLESSLGMNKKPHTNSDCNSFIHEVKNKNQLIFSKDLYD